MKISGHTFARGWEGYGWKLGLARRNICDECSVQMSDRCWGGRIDSSSELT